MKISKILPILILAVLFAGCIGSQPVPTPQAPNPTLVTAAAPAPTHALPTPTQGPAAAVPVGAVTGMPQGSGGSSWWNDTVFYEIFVRSFYDSNGDGKGDFNGIVQKLDYLKDLGVTGLWLMPIFPTTTYHGYDVVDYLTTNPDYGTLDDFKRLLAEAQKRDIRVIIDMVFNHTSDQNPWFQASQDPKSPYRNWYVWSKTDPGFVGPFNEKVWYKAGTGDYYYAVFDQIMPDLNYNEPAVTAKMDEVTRFWLQDVKVDGFRLDAVRYLVEQGKQLADSSANHQWFKQFRTFYKSIAPQAVTIGEVRTTNYAVAGYLKGDELDMAFNFDLAGAFIKSANSGAARNAIGQLKLDQPVMPSERTAPLLTNHDDARVMSQLGNDDEKAKNAATMLLTAAGSPFIYYGEEIGMFGGKPDPQIRTPMQWSAEPNAGFTTGTPWEAVYPFYEQANVAAENGKPDSLLSYYRTLIHLRSQHIGLRLGETDVVDSGDAGSVYAVLRAAKDEALLVVINLSPDTVQGLKLSLSAGPLAGTYRVAPVLGSGPFPDLAANVQGGFDGYAPLPDLPGNSRLILQLQPQK
ncbi:MAG TPA: alpha-amylase family glycosyl hydrolase [Anaerolineales bacterium]